MLPHVAKRKARNDGIRRFGVLVEIQAEKDATDTAQALYL